MYCMQGRSSVSQSVRTGGLGGEAAADGGAHGRAGPAITAATSQLLSVQAPSRHTDGSVGAEESAPAACR